MLAYLSIRRQPFAPARLPNMDPPDSGPSIRLLMLLIIDFSAPLKGSLLARRILTIRQQFPADTEISGQRSKRKEVIPAAGATSASSMAQPAPQTCPEPTCIICYPPKQTWCAPQTCILCQPSQSTTLPKQDAKVEIEITSDADGERVYLTPTALPVGATTKINPCKPAEQSEVAPPPDDETRKAPPYDAKAKDAPPSDEKISVAPPAVNASSPILVPPPPFVADSKVSPSLIPPERWMMPRQQVVPTPNAEPKSLSQGTTCNTSNGYIPVPHHFLSTSIMITPMATQTRPSMLSVMGPTGPMDIRSSGQIPTQFPLQQPLSTASSEVPTLSSPTPETAVEATPEVRKKRPNTPHRKPVVEKEDEREKRSDEQWSKDDCAEKTWDYSYTRTKTWDYWYTNAWKDWCDDDDDHRTWKSDSVSPSSTAWSSSDDGSKRTRHY